MIITAILNILYQLLEILLNPFTGQADFLLSSGFLSAFSTLGGFLNGIDALIPINTFFIVIGALIGLETSLMIYKGVMLVVKFLRG